jgi:hypothetical protein
MLFALAALFIQPHFNAQLSFSAERIALVQPANPASANLSSAEVMLPLSPATSDIDFQPPADPAVEDLPSAPEPVMASTTAPMAFLKPARPMTVSVAQLMEENRRNQRIWRGLLIASHSAATFDAWSTRHAITTTGAQEMDPLLKPFAGNASLYVAIQAGPAVMDFVARKMMYSKYSWMRHTWWVPQSASFVASLFCGAHNLTVH